MLSALSLYGSTRSCIRAADGVALGHTLHGAVAEDAFDGQPRAEGSPFLIAADIRIDNRTDVERHLRIACAAQISDSDLLLMAWAKWGQKALDHIVGDYAFAIYDGQTRTLTLARDPTGQRPLYYWHGGDVFAFASMVSGILSCPLVNTSIDFRSMAAMVAGTHHNGGSTYFSGVERVQAGQIVVWSATGLAKHWHWVPPQDVSSLSDEEYVAAYRELLDESVSATMRRNSGNLAVHLSSGWDSSAVAATAARKTTGSVMPIAYTAAPRLGFNGPVPRTRFADESALARLVAAKYHLEHHIVRPDRGVLDGLRDHVRFYQEPNFNVANMGWLTQIYELAQTRGVSTLLSGQMGNLTLNAGGLSALSEWVRRGDWFTWWAEAKAATREAKARWRGVLFSSFDRQIPATAANLLERMFRDVPSVAAKSFARREWLGGNRLHAKSQADMEIRSQYQSRLALIRSNDVGNFRKGALAQFGIDERDPTADRRLLDFSFSLPPDQLLHLGVWRPLARRALADRVPEPILASGLRGYQGADWFERIGPVQARDLLDDVSTNTSVRDLLDIAKIERAIADWPDGGWEQRRQIQIYRTRLPVALAAGVFIQEFETLPARAKAI